MLESIDTWTVVGGAELPSKWVFKCKRNPDGSIKKIKGSFCAEEAENLNTSTIGDSVDSESEGAIDPIDLGSEGAGHVQLTSV